MRRKRFYFPNVAKGTSTFHVAVTAKTLMERSGEVTNVFTKYTDNKLPHCPGQILYLMSKANESLFELGESSSPVKSSPESSSTATGTQSVSSLKRKRLSFGDPAKSADSKAESLPVQKTVSVSPRKKASSTVSKASDLIPSQEVGSQEQTPMIISSPSKSVIKILSPTKKPQKDASPTTQAQESAGPSKKAKMSEEPDSGSPGQEFKIPAVPGKDEQAVFKRAKRPKLVDNVADIPPLSPRKRASTPSDSSPRKRASTPSDSSPRKRAKTPSDSAKDEKMDISPKKRDELSPGPSKDSQVFATSPAGFESPQKLESLLNYMPIVEDDAIELDVSNREEENIGAIRAAEAAEIAELNNLENDPTRIEFIKSAVGDHLKVIISPKKIEVKFKLPKKPSTPSPRKSRRLNSPGEDASRSEPRVQLSHPNVLAYIKMRFKSVLSNRNRYMRNIYSFFQELDGDVKFLYFYASCILTVVNDLLIEDKEYFTEDLRNLKGRIVTNATERCNTLRALINNIKMDIPFFGRGIRDTKRLNQQNRYLLSEESGSQTTVESLKRYEHNLRKIWDRMDSRILVGDRIKSSVVGISADYARLTQDFGRYLVMVELMKPSSIASSEAEKSRLRTSYY